MLVNLLLGLFSTKFELNTILKCFIHNVRRRVPKLHLIFYQVIFNNIYTRLKQGRIRPWLKSLIFNFKCTSGLFKGRAFSHYE
jgi:hypothetical protein